jgi:hypothetical protein
MRRRIIIRGEQRQDIDLDRLARALLRAAREAAKDAEAQPEPEPLATSVEVPHAS